MKERQVLANVTGGRYRKAAKRKKGEILQKFCQSTGCRRKYVITLLRIGK